MEFSFVFAKGRMRVDGSDIRADGALVRCELPRGPAMADDVNVRFDGRDAAIPAIDVLGAVRALHDDSSWMLSGARAQIVAERSDAQLVSAAERAAAAHRLWQLRDGLDWGRVDVEESGEREWTVTAFDTSGMDPLTPTTRSSRSAADRLADAQAEKARDRVLSARTGLALKRIGELRDGGPPPTLDEIIRIAAAIDEAPSSLLG